jgi:predicted small metal-binding protein
MNASIGCKELGIACDFVIEGKTRDTVVESLIRHVKEEHTDDWFEIEEIYQVACTLVREKAA